MSAGHWDKLRAQVTDMLSNAFHSGAFPEFNGSLGYPKMLAVRIVNDFLAGEYPMFVVHVEDILTKDKFFDRQQRWINIRKRKHWRRYARRHNLNMKTGARR